MAKKPFFIGPYTAGVINANKPWLLPENAFASLENMFVWRELLRKRLGEKPLDTSFTGDLIPLGSRLRLQIGTTDAVTGNFNHGGLAVPGTKWAVGQQFSIGTTVFTVYQAAGAMLTTGTATGTFDTATGMINIVGGTENPLTAVWYYPADPVMGFANYENIAINNEPTYGFDTQFAYQRDAAGWLQLGTATWTGNDNQFFWPCNYRGATNDSYVLFVVNNNRADGIKYWNGAAWATITPQTRQNAPAPELPANYVLQSARIVLPFKDRLVFLNTLETVDNGSGNPRNATFTHRARWCWNRSPVYSSGAAALCLGSYYDEVPGVGGFADAATKQAIVSAQILKDRLLVYFERSTWELAYTGNYAIPFVWHVIDDKLGAESTFSTLLLDKVVVGIGETGIHASDGLTVSRIDEQIPTFVDRLHNGNNGVERIAGVRDFYNELILWAVPESQLDPTYPNKILVYNYVNKSWAFFDDSITAFGYYQNTDDLTWEEDTSVWEEDTGRWNSGTSQSLFKNVIAGNQQGFTFLLDRDLGRNAEALQITSLDAAAFPVITMTVVNHNLQIGDYVLIEHCAGITTNLNNRIYKVITVTNTNIVQVQASDATLVPVGAAYTGGGTLTRVSIPIVKTKEYNFYGEDVDMIIEDVSFSVDKTNAGKLQLDFYCDTNSGLIGSASIANGTSMGTLSIDFRSYPGDTFEANRDRLYRTVYLLAYGECIQLVLTIKKEYCDVLEIALSPYVINSMTFYARQAGMLST